MSVALLLCLWSPWENTSGDCLPEVALPLPLYPPVLWHFCEEEVGLVPRRPSSPLSRPQTYCLNTVVEEGGLKYKEECLGCLFSCILKGKFTVEYMYVIYVIRKTLVEHFSTENVKT